MASESVSFFGKSAYDMAEFFSVAADSLDGKAEAVVVRVTEAAEDRMLSIIDSGGINPTKKGGPRRVTGDMRDSVISARDDVTNSYNRVVGSYGFSDDAPFYTKFQERGTGSSGPARAKGSGGFGGIPAMLAFAEAQAHAITEMSNLMQSVHWVSASKTI